MTEQPTQGRLVVFEGFDGAGKSTLAEHLASRLRGIGVPCEHLAFPGRRPGSLGRLVYDLHHDAPGLGLGEVNATSLQVLHIAAHVDSIEGEILPALRAGKWVVLDRFWWSTWVYGAAYGVSERSLEEMIELEKIHWGNVKPDVLFLVEREDGTADKRVGLQEQILERYRELAKRERSHSRVVTLHNDSSVEDAIDAAWDAITPLAQQLTKGRGFPAAAQPSSQLTLLEDRTPQPPRMSRLSPAKPTTVYDTFWRFAAERQEVLFRRIEGFSPPWTHDSILAHYKFTNAYRASDRVSQYLISNVIYEGSQSPEEVFFRTLLFKIFNRIETWELLKGSVGDVEYSSYSFDVYDSVLVPGAGGGPGHLLRSLHHALGQPASLGMPKKHRNHLKLIERMMADEAANAGRRGPHDAGCLQLAAFLPIHRRFPRLPVRD